MQSVTEITTIEQLTALQGALRALPQYEPECHHYFADGMYCREVPRPAGALVVGKVHKKEHFYIVATGIVTITGPNEAPRTIEGPKIMVSHPGTKRAVFAHTDAVCITVHRTDKTDLEEIEAELVEDDPDSMYAVGNVLKREQIE
jgi:hypothetical protein